MLSRASIMSCLLIALLRRALLRALWLPLLTTRRILHLLAHPFTLFRGHLLPPLAYFLALLRRHVAHTLTCALSSALPLVTMVWHGPSLTMRGGTGLLMAFIQVSPILLSGLPNPTR